MTDFFDVLPWILLTVGVLYNIHYAFRGILEDKVVSTIIHGYFAAIMIWFAVSVMADLI